MKDVTTHLEHTTLSATLASEHTDLWKVYLGRRGANGGEHILQLVDHGDNFRTKRIGRHVVEKG